MTHHVARKRTRHSSPTIPFNSDVLHESAQDSSTSWLYLQFFFSSSSSDIAPPNPILLPSTADLLPGGGAKKSEINTRDGYHCWFWFKPSPTVSFPSNISTSHPPHAHSTLLHTTSNEKKHMIENVGGRGRGGLTTKSRENGGGGGEFNV